MFFNIASSKYCPPGIADPSYLRDVYPYKEFLKLKEFIDSKISMDMAVQKDQEAESTKGSNK